MKKTNYQRGFALSGGILAWVLGLASLFGGANYVANKKIASQTPVQATRTTNTYMNQNQNHGNGMDHSFVPDHNELFTAESGELSEKEREGLITMREEEKLARDVYRTLYDKWGVQTFQNISYSENRHTLAMKTLLDKYGIEDPVKDDTTGEFTIDEMQKLYDALVDQGSNSLVDALKVGATVEDLDISDLKKWISITDNEDILLSYDNLIRGSRNHIRSYVSQIEAQGASYEAQYLSQDELNEILKGDHEKGSHVGNNGRRNGQGLRDGSGAGRGQGQGLRDGSGRGQGRGMGRGQGRMMRNQ